MNLLLVGAGYAGLITAVCFANSGNKVYVYDKDQHKLDLIKEGNPPFFEKNLNSALAQAVANDDLVAVSDLYSGFQSAEIIFVCVGTPSKRDGSIDLSQIDSVMDELAELLKKSSERKIIVIRSTVVPGTTVLLTKRLERLASKTHPIDFGMVSNPEFLRQGNAMEDFLKNNKVIIGSEHLQDSERILELYIPFGKPASLLSTKAAEMAKYVSNCLIATKLSFINEMGVLAKELGIDIYDITEALDLKTDLGGRPLKAGCGFGGSCLEKDTKALLELARKQGSECIILNSAIEVNNYLPYHMLEILEKRLMGIEGRKIGVLGLSFKKGTDDIRNSRSIPLINELMKKGAHVSASDPKAIEKMKEVFPDITYHQNPRKLIEESDAVVIMSDWDDFAALDYGGTVVIDGRNVIPKKRRSKNYEGICWP